MDERCGAAATQEAGRLVTSVAAQGAPSEAAGGRGGGPPDTEQSDDESVTSNSVSTPSRALLRQLK